MINVVDKIKEEAKTYFEGSCPSHDWSHVERVYDLALKIAKEENADSFIIKIATLLHDVGRKKEEELGDDADHAKISAEIAEGIFNKYDLYGDRAVNALHCIETHRFRKNNPPQTIEAKVLFDADKLDCLGAIGVARAYAWAGSKGLKLYSDKDYLGTGYEKDHSPVTEFLFKLTKVKDRMLTETGKQIALDRHNYIEEYFNRLTKEVSKQ